MQGTHLINSYAVDALGFESWWLLRTYGILTSGPCSEQFVAGLPVERVIGLVESLAAGQVVDVHMSDRGYAGGTMRTRLRWECGALMRVFPDHEEPIVGTGQR